MIFIFISHIVEACVKQTLEQVRAIRSLRVRLKARLDRSATTVYGASIGPEDDEG